MKFIHIFLAAVLATIAFPFNLVTNILVGISNWLMEPYMKEVREWEELNQFDEWDN